MGLSSAKAPAWWLSRYVVLRPIKILRSRALTVEKEEAHALARKATIYARLIGYGATSDAYHITQPPENGEGARRSMLQALGQAGRQQAAVDYINAHATSTPLGDRAEAIAISHVLQSNSASQKHGGLVSSTKGATGHLLGAAGAVEAIFTILAVQGVSLLSRWRHCTEHHIEHCATNDQYG